MLVKVAPGDQCRADKGFRIKSNLSKHGNEHMARVGLPVTQLDLIRPVTTVYRALTNLKNGIAYMYL